MKKFVLLFLLVIHIKAFAQKDEAFFCKDSASIKDLASLIMETTKNKYALDMVRPHGRHDVEIWYRFESHELVRMHFKILLDGSAVLAGLTGRFEDIFPFWKKYFQPDADMKVLEKMNSEEYVRTTFLQGKATFRFRKLTKYLCEIKTLYEMEPPKK